MTLRSFKKVYVEISSACNLSCSFCPPTRRPPVLMTPDQFRRIVGQVAPVTGHIYLHVKGEPLVHPRLPELLDLAGSRGLKVHLVTNGTLVHRWQDLLATHPAVHRINISLHSFERDSGPQESYFAAVVALVRQTEPAGGPTISLRFWTGPESPLVKSVAQAFGWEPPTDLGQEAARGFRLGPNLWVNFDRQFRWPSASDPPGPEKGFCLGLRDQLAVLVDGTVVPCCLDGEGLMKLGNLYDQDLGAIVNGPRARAIYQGFSENRCVEDLCRRCQFRDRFTPGP